MEISIHPDYRGKCQLAVLYLKSTWICPSPDSLNSEIERIVGRRRRFFKSDEALAVPGVEEAREVFRNFGVDPNRTRPCSEAFLRRLLRGDEFPHVFNLVDLNNYCSVEMATPICVYDFSRVEGEITFRPGLEGESFDSITGKEIDAAEFPVFADRQGPFGSPFVDSRRTRIRATTEDAIAVWLAHPDYPKYALVADAETYGERAARYDIAEPGQIRLIQS